MAELSIRRELNDIVTSIRPELTMAPGIDIEDAIAISHKLETLRILITSEPSTSGLTERVGVRLGEVALELMQMPGYSHLAARRFRLRALSPRREPTSELYERLKKERITIAEAFEHFFVRLNEAAFQAEFNLSGEQNPGMASRLASIVPTQKIGPVRFDITNEKLVVEHSPATPAEEDRSVASSARAALIEQGQAVLDGLRRSNCDLRFIDSIQELHNKLGTVQDIIQLGIFNLTCEEMRMQFEAELPDVLSAKLRSHLSSVSMYVAQFPEWARYSENASSVELSELDIRRSQEVAADLISKFDAIPDRVDPEVPRTIKLIMDAVADPRRTTKRAAYALFSTLENLFIKIFGYASDFAHDLVTQSSKKISTWGASALATIFVKAVLEGAGILAPIYARLPDAAWVKSAVEIIKQISI